MSGFETEKPESWSWQQYAIQLERVIDRLQHKNGSFEELVKIMDYLTRNDFLSAKERTLKLMKHLQELDQKK